jgi:hypothetical protein
MREWRGSGCFCIQPASTRDKVEATRSNAQQLGAASPRNPRLELSPQDIVRRMPIISTNTLAFASSLAPFESEQGFTAWPFAFS